MHATTDLPVAMRALLAGARRKQPALLDLIQKFVRAESPSDDKAAVDACVALAAAHARGLGGRVKLLFQAPDRAGQFYRKLFSTVFHYAAMRVPEIADDSLTEAEQKEGFKGGRVWFAGSADPERQHTGEGAVIGRILISLGHWRLEAMGADRFARLRERFEQLMGQRVTFKGERRDDLGAQLRMKEPNFDPALVPPTLLRDTPKLLVTTSRVAAPTGTVPDDAAAAGIIYDREHGILDEPIPALENKTPAPPRPTQPCARSCSGG